MTAIGPAPASHARSFPAHLALDQGAAGSRGFLEPKGGLQGKPSMPSSLERLMSTPSALQLLATEPSIIAMGRRDPPPERTTITVQAPVENAFGVIDRTRIIVISVRPLSGGELGSLNTSPSKIPQILSDASVRINRENIDAYGKTTAELKRDADNSGYYQSPAHMAWSQAAEARTGGVVPASWWRENDPFGGTAGNGPNILPGGAYPGEISKIAMAHDTDWTLGRQFGAGPLQALETMGGTPEDRGFYGLSPVA